MYSYVENKDKNIESCWAKIAVPTVLKLATRRRSQGWLESFKFNTVKFAILNFCKHKLLTNKNT